MPKPKENKLAQITDERAAELLYRSRIPHAIEMRITPQELEALCTGYLAQRMGQWLATHKIKESRFALITGTNRVRVMSPVETMHDEQGWISGVLYDTVQNHRCVMDATEFHTYFEPIVEPTTLF